MLRPLLSLGIVLAVMFRSGLGQESTPDIYSLLIAPVDLNDATNAMTIYDADEDGFIDSREQTRIPWKKDISHTDLNGDAKLTHLELVIRYARLREEAGIKQEHVDNATVYLKRNDKNQNGQLDADEIANGWPSEPNEFDTNEDDIITLSEIAARFSFMSGLRREMGIEQVDQVTAVRTLRAFDTNGNRKLSPEEQKGALLPLPASEADRDKDGQLDNMEIATMIAKYRMQTGLSETDLMQLRALFTRFDSNGDGIIDEDEYRSAGEQATRSPQGSPLQALDANKDRMITYQEAGQSLADSRKALGFDDRHMSEARRLLARHDEDRSTYIEASELLDRAAAGRLAKSVLPACDADKDGRISLQELAKYLASKAAD